MKNSPIWFLLVLFLCNVLHTITSKIKFSNYVVLIGCFVISCFELYFGNGMCWYMAFFACMFFYELGFLFKNIKISVNELLYFISGIVMLVLWVIVSLYNGNVDVIWVQYGKSFILLIITSLLAINVLFMLSKKLNKYKVSNFLKIFGKNSMAILLTHYYLTKFMVPKTFAFLGYSGLEHNVFVEFILLILFIILYYFAFVFKQKIVKK